MRSSRRSLTAQITEIELTLAERRRSVLGAQDSYRLASLESVLATLQWLQRNAEAIRTLFQGEDSPKA